MDRQTEILIIGGGVIGACCAFYLTRLGKQVTLVERGEICSEVSDGNACWVAAAYALPTAAPGVMGQGLRWILDSASPYYTKPLFNFVLFSWLWQFRDDCTNERMMARAPLLLQLNRQSLQLFRDLAEIEKLEFGYSERGLLTLHQSEKARNAGEQEAEILRGLGIEAISLDRKGLIALEPNLKAEVTSAIFYPEHAHLNASKLVNAVADQAKLEGATILTHSEVTGFTLREVRITEVKISDDSIQAEEVVLAAGAWSSILAKQLGAPILMEPAKGYSITAKRKFPDHGPTRSISIDDARVAVTPLGIDRFRFSSTLELVGFDPGINTRRLAASREAMQSIFSDMEALDEEKTFYGYRPLTPDGLPYIGRSEKIQNLVFATGHGKMGLTHGPITGQLVSQIIGGKNPSIDLTLLRPERF